MSADFDSNVPYRIKDAAFLKELNIKFPWNQAEYIDDLGRAVGHCCHLDYGLIKTVLTLFETITDRHDTELEAGIVNFEVRLSRTDYINIVLVRDKKDPDMYWLSVPEGKASTHVPVYGIECLPRILWTARQMLSDGLKLIFSKAIDFEAHIESLGQSLSPEKMEDIITEMAGMASTNETVSEIDGVQMTTMLNKLYLCRLTRQSLHSPVRRGTFYELEFPREHVRRKYEISTDAKGGVTILDQALFLSQYGNFKIYVSDDLKTFQLTQIRRDPVNGRCYDSPSIINGNPSECFEKADQFLIECQNSIENRTLKNQIQSLKSFFEMVLKTQQKARLEFIEFDIFDLLYLVIQHRNRPV